MRGVGEKWLYSQLCSVLYLDSMATPEDPPTDGPFTAEQLAWLNTNRYRRPNTDTDTSVTTGEDGAGSSRGTRTDAPLTAEQLAWLEANRDRRPNNPGEEGAGSSGNTQTQGELVVKGPMCTEQDSIPGVR